MLILLQNGGLTMISKIIFDLDNTLIDWQEDFYTNSVKALCQKYGISSYYSEVLKLVEQVMENYEKKYEYFKVLYMVKELNLYKEELNNTNFNFVFTEDFVNSLLVEFSYCVPKHINPEIVETLEFLNSKYSLVVLTNWFAWQQAKRLERSKLLKYFDNVYGTEDVKIKPNKEAFIMAAGNIPLDNCLMVGDNYKTDICGALNAGLHVIFYNRKNEKVESNVTSIKSFSELKTLL